MFRPTKIREMEILAYWNHRRRFSLVFRYIDSDRHAILSFSSSFLFVYYSNDVFVMLVHLHCNRFVLSYYITIRSGLGRNKYVNKQIRINRNKYFYFLKRIMQSLVNILLWNSISNLYFNTNSYKYYCEISI